MRRSLVVSLYALALGLLSQPLEAQSLGVGAGAVKIEDSGSSLFLTANLRLKLIGPIVLEPEAGYWKKSEQLPAGEVSAEDFSLGGNGLLVLPAHPLEIFGGVGAGAHFLNRSAGFSGLLRKSDQTKFGVHFLAGLDFVVSDSLNLFGVVRRDTFSDDELGAVPSQTKLYGGLRFKF